MLFGKSINCFVNAFVLYLWSFPFRSQQFKQKKIRVHLGPATVWPRLLYFFDSMLAENNGNSRESVNRPELTIHVGKGLNCLALRRYDPSFGRPRCCTKGGHQKETTRHGKAFKPSLLEILNKIGSLCPGAANRATNARLAASSWARPGVSPSAWRARSGSPAYSSTAQR